jgi:hypothetical protein
MLNTRTQKPHWLARAGAAAMIIAAFGLTAPLTQAEVHPDEELAGKADKHTSKSVMKFVTDKDGKEVKKHFEITIDGDDVKAIEIDEDGNVTRINPDDIEGFDLGAMRGSKAWAFSLDEDMKLEFLDSVKAAQRMGGVDLSFLEDMDLAEMLESAKGNKFVFRGQNGDIQSFEFPTPPTPPKGLKALRLKKGTDFDVEAMQLGAQMQAARSMLEAAEDMIREAEATAQNGKKASKAQRELAKARKALRDAEKALSEE